MVPEKVLTPVKRLCFNSLFTVISNPRARGGRNLKVLILLQAKISPGACPERNRAGSEMEANVGLPREDRSCAMRGVLILDYRRLAIVL
jgi:hypothetical protein